jgi:hypothetical protein
MRDLMKNGKRLGLLSVLCVLSVLGIGMAAAASANGSPNTLTGTTSVPTAPTCQLDVVNAAWTPVTTMALSNAPTTIYVANLGQSGWTGGINTDGSYQIINSSMSVTLQGTDWTQAAPSTYTFPVGATQWSSVLYPAGFSLTIAPSGPATDPLVNTNGADVLAQALTFNVMAPAGTAGGAYSQAITIIGNC